MAAPTIVAAVDGVTSGIVASGGVGVAVSGTAGLAMTRVASVSSGGGGGASLLSTIRYVPSTAGMPGSSIACCTRRPATQVPFWLLRSTIENRPCSNRSSAWNRDTD